MKRIGRNINTTDTVATTSVTINSVTATTLLAANPNRLWAKVSLAAGTLDQQAYIRDYAAATDNIKKGEVIARVTSGNNNLFKPLYQTDTDNVYTGEISAIALAGTFTVHIMEG